MLRVDTERHFLPGFKNRGLAPSNVSNKKFTKYNQVDIMTPPKCEAHREDQATDEEIVKYLITKPGIKGNYTIGELAHLLGDEVQRG
jgi:hypothetical protein